jgi:hypothetical protein
MEHFVVLFSVSNAVFEKLNRDVMSTLSIDHPQQQTMVSKTQLMFRKRENLH